MKIATHSGRFHADDVFALATLQLAGVVDELLRTRDEAMLASCDLRVDVGRKNDPERGDFDHHQPGGGGQRSNGVPYASFGLIWERYGAAVAGSAEAATFIDTNLVQPIDADDAGTQLFTSQIAGLQPYDMGRLIDRYNPSWSTDPTSDMMDQAFDQAVTFASDVLRREIAEAKARLKASQFIKAAIAAVPGQPIIELSRYAPWRETVIREAPNVLYVVAPVWPRREQDWSVEAVPERVDSFELRKPLPASWLGKVDAELASVTGVPDARFCHVTGFMAIARSQAGAQALAAAALKA